MLKEDTHYIYDFVILAFEKYILDVIPFNLDILYFVQAAAQA